MRPCLSTDRAAALALAALALAACGGSTTSPTPGACPSGCPANQVCTDGVCEPIPDAGSGCTSDAQCAPGVCNASTGSCVASLCSPACAAWETCSGRTCSLSPGSCNSASDCTAALPICNASHTCAAPPLAQPATPTYAALIITNQEYAPSFQQIAQLHTLTGVPTRVETVEDICAAAPGGCSTTDLCNDAPKAIKDYIIGQYGQGVTQVVLGGDASIVPGRLTEAKYSNPLYPPAFDEFFYSDDYYGDISEWDTNHDCVYGDDSNDTPLYTPAVAITRISVSTLAELSAYFAKETAYLTAYDTTRLNNALFLSNIATTLDIAGVNVTIDAALYFEAPGRTLSYVPDAIDITKLYSSLAWPDSQPLTVPAEISAIQQGYNLIVHSGHGDEVDVTVEQDGSNEFSGDQAYALQNTQYPIMVSCACEAATFADGETCAGEQFITAPNGGGIGYLGNSTIGLGIAGGMQLLDQFVKYTYTNQNPLVGDAVLAAHVNMPTSDGLTIDFPVVGDETLPVVDITSWRWTQKAATYLGDGLLPIYTNLTMTKAPHIAVQKTLLGNYSQLTFTPDDGPVGTLMILIGTDLYELPVAGYGAAQTITVPGVVTQLTYGFSSVMSLAAYQQVTLP